MLYNDGLLIMNYHLNQSLADDFSYEPIYIYFAAGRGFLGTIREPVDEEETP